MANALQTLLFLSVAVFSLQMCMCTLTGLLENVTLGEWAEITSGNETQPEVYTQYIFTGTSFRCSGNVTGLSVIANQSMASSEHTVIGIYRNVGGTSYNRTNFTRLEMQPNSVSRIFTFNLDSDPLEFQTEDVLGIYQPPNSSLHIDIREVTNGREYGSINPRQSTPDGLAMPMLRTTNHNLLPLINVHIASDDGDASNCTSNFISRDLLTLTEETPIQRSAQQLLLIRTVFQSNGFIIGWTLAAEFKNRGNNFPQLQIWQRDSNVPTTTYNLVSSIELQANSESLNQLYSGVVDPPLPFRLGDMMGLFLPNNTSGSNGTRLGVYFGNNTLGPTYQVVETNEPLQSIPLDGTQGSDNLQPFFALKTTGVIPSTSVPTQPSTTPTATTTSDPGNEDIGVGPAVGIAVGILALVVMILISVGCVMLFTIKKKRKKYSSKTDGKPAKDGDSSTLQRMVTNSV